jgi:hypothetical protein
MSQAIGKNVPFGLDGAAFTSMAVASRVVIVAKNCMMLTCEMLLVELSSVFGYK